MSTDHVARTQSTYSTLYSTQSTPYGLDSELAPSVDPEPAQSHSGPITHVQCSHIPPPSFPHRAGAAGRAAEPVSTKRKTARKYHLWTAKEREFLKANVQLKTRAEMARLLGLRTRQVEKFCDIQGIYTFPANRRGEARERNEKRVAELHALGLVDRQIAERAELSSGMVYRIRRRLGLRSNSMRPEHLAARVEGMRRWRRRNGVDSTSQLVSLKKRLEVLKRGWELAMNFGHADILDLIEQAPRTSNEVAEILGIPKRLVRGRIHKLVQLKAIVNTRPAKQPGSGHAYGLYQLAPGVINTRNIPETF